MVDVKAVLGITRGDEVVKPWEDYEAWGPLPAQDPQNTPASGCVPAKFTRMLIKLGYSMHHDFQATHWRR